MLPLLFECPKPTQSFLCLVYHLFWVTVFSNIDYCNSVLMASVLLVPVQQPQWSSKNISWQNPVGSPSEWRLKSFEWPLLPPLWLLSPLLLCPSHSGSLLVRIQEAHSCLEPQIGCLHWLESFTSSYPYEKCLQPLKSYLKRHFVNEAHPDYLIKNRTHHPFPHGIYLSLNKW